MGRYFETGEGRKTSNEGLNMKDKKEHSSRKQITFDLSQEALSKNYPRPKLSINPLYYKKAYRDISRFMKAEGFEHRQYSVYCSKEPLTDRQLFMLTAKMAKQMPWLYSCVNEIDVTDIGEELYSIKEMLGEYTRDNEEIYVKRESEKQTEETGVSMSEWKTKVSGNNSFAKQMDDRARTSEPRDDIGR